MRRRLGLGLALLVAAGLALGLVRAGRDGAPSPRAQLNRRLAAAVTGLVHRVTPLAAAPVTGLVHRVTPHPAAPATGLVPAGHRPLPRAVTGWSCRVAAGSPCGRPSCTVYVASRPCTEPPAQRINRILTLPRRSGSPGVLKPTLVPRLGGLFSQIHAPSGTP